MARPSPPPPGGGFLRAGVEAGACPARGGEAHGGGGGQQQPRQPGNHREEGREGLPDAGAERHRQHGGLGGSGGRPKPWEGGPLGLKRKPGHHLRCGCLPGGAAATMFVHPKGVGCTNVAFFIKNQTPDCILHHFDGFVNFGQGDFFFGPPQKKTSNPIMTPFWPFFTENFYRKPLARPRTLGVGLGVGRTHPPSAPEKKEARWRPTFYE